MPRKLRAPKQRTGSAIQISDALFHWLVFRDWNEAISMADASGDGELPALLYIDSTYKTPGWWASIVDDGVAAWAERFPGTRPELWWQLTAPELRHVVRGPNVPIAGHGRCHYDGTPYVNVANFRDPKVWVEPTPAYLDRLGLWLPRERARVPASAFEPRQLFGGVRPEQEALAWMAPR